MFAPPDNACVATCQAPDKVESLRIEFAKGIPVKVGEMRQQ